MCFYQHYIFVVPELTRILFEMKNHYINSYQYYMATIQIKQSGSLEVIKYTTILEEGSINLNEIEKIILTKYGLKRSQYTMFYKDTDGDQIVAEYQDDIEVARLTMIEHGLIFYVVVGSEVVVMEKDLEKQKGEQLKIKEEEKELKIVVDTDKIEQKYQKEQMNQIESQNNGTHQKVLNQVVIEEKPLNEISNEQKSQIQINILRLIEEDIENKLILQMKNQQIELKTEEQQQKYEIQLTKDEQDLKIKNQKEKAQIKEKAKKEASEERMWSKDSLLKLMREQVLSMIPSILDQVRKDPFRNQVITGNNQCSFCKKHVGIPYYYNTNSQTKLCCECQKNDNGSEPLLKIRSKIDSDEIVWMSFIQLGKQEVNHSLKEEPILFYSDVKQAVIKRVKQQIDLKIMKTKEEKQLMAQELKRKQKQEQLKKAQQQKLALKEQQKKKQQLSKQKLKQQSIKNKKNQKQAQQLH